VYPFVSGLNQLAVKLKGEILGTRYLSYLDSDADLKGAEMMHQ